MIVAPEITLVCSLVWRTLYYAPLRCVGLKRGVLVLYILLACVTSQSAVKPLTAPDVGATYGCTKFRKNSIGSRSPVSQHELGKNEVHYRYRSTPLLTPTSKARPNVYQAEAQTTQTYHTIITTSISPGYHFQDLL